MMLFIFLLMLQNSSFSSFSRVPLFHNFYPKLDSNIHFDSVFWNIGWFNRKTVNVVWFPITRIRILINFMHSRSKQTSEICQKVQRLDGKTNQNRLKALTLPFFFLKKPLYLLKNDKRLSTSNWKNKCMFLQILCVYH